jgi:hypothetical protein
MPLLDPAPHLPNDLPRPRFPPSPLCPTARTEAPLGFDRDPRAEPSATFQLDDVSELVAARWWARRGVR